MSGTSSGEIIISQVGIDARYAADYQMIFNSNWPSLQICFEALVTVSNSTVTVPHGLGFPPFLQAWVILNGVSIGRSFATSGSLFGPQTDPQVTFDDQNIYITNSAIFNASYQVNIKCYNLDISQQVDYTLPMLPTIKRTYDPSTGIKVTKYGKSMGSNDLNDYILHSRAQSPAVLAVVTTPPAGKKGLIGYTNPVDYVPWVFAFSGGLKSANKVYTPLAPGAQQSGYEFVIQSKEAMNPAFFGGFQNALLSFDANASANIGSLVVLRDPLVVANTASFTY